MKKISLALLLVIISAACAAQKHDYTWVGGETRPNQSMPGGFTIDFRQNPAHIENEAQALDLFQSCAAICDTSGRLLLYTNGCDIASDLNNSVILNGENINPGSVNSQYCNDPDFEYYPVTSQSNLFLPMPDSINKYILFHKRTKLVYNPLDVIIDTLYYSLVDMSLNFGKGEVVSKNIPIVGDTLASGMMTAVKHANGKDWWVLTPRRNEQQWYIFHLTSMGITDTLFQQGIGFDHLPNQEGSAQMVFTPDGSKLIITSPYAGVNIFDFDRSVGLLSNHQQFPIANLSQFASVIGGAVSPNGRYLYVSAIVDLFQYDLWADDIAASQVLIDSWDGTSDPLPTTFLFAHLGPDCKIYLQTGQQAKALHVIHHPDEAGQACNFEQRGLALPVPNRGSLPYFPHFRLGPLDNPGLPCSPVVSTTAPPTPLPGFSVFPNPASDYLKVVPNRAWSGTARLILVDQLGRTAANWDFDPQHSVHTFDLSGLHAGLYAWQVRCEGVVQQTGKVLVAR
jgi:hypothetical protein